MVDSMAPAFRSTQQSGLGFQTRRQWLEKALLVALGSFTAGLPGGVLSPTSKNRDRYDLLSYYGPDGNRHPVRSFKDWQRRRAAVLKAMEEVMGPLPGPEKRCPLNLEVAEQPRQGGSRRFRLTYQSEPNSRVPAYLWVPDVDRRRRQRHAAILTLHQTDRRTFEVLLDERAPETNAYARELAERGFVCLAPAYPLLGQYEPNLTQLGYRSGTMKAIWDNIRAVDLLAALPFVDATRVGAIGHSLGGHNAIFTAVFEPRIRCIVSSCGLDSFEDYMGGNIRGWTSTRYMPALLDYPSGQLPFDFPELIASLAPRPCFLSAPVGDSNFRWWSVDKVAALARPVYGLARAGNALEVKHPDCEHSFPGPMRAFAYEWLERSLVGR